MDTFISYFKIFRRTLFWALRKCNSHRFRYLLAIVSIIVNFQQVLAWKPVYFMLRNIFLKIIIRLFLSPILGWQRSTLIQPKQCCVICFFSSIVIFLWKMLALLILCFQFPIALKKFSPLGPLSCYPSCLIRS